MADLLPRERPGQPFDRRSAQRSRGSRPRSSPAGGKAGPHSRRCLSDLDAQVDYLVSELRTGCRQVYGTLTAPGVTTEQASDAVRSISNVRQRCSNRPIADPGVQQVVRRRRSHAVGALQVYRAARCR
jgi:hypothetical protein